MNYKIYLILMPVLLLAIPIAPRSFEGKCLRVIDGDTIILERGDLKERIRLAFIDAPELSQMDFLNKSPIGDKSKKALEKLILGKRIKVKLYGRGKYGRWIGEVYHKLKNINLTLVEKGHVILYKYSSYPSNKIRAHYHSTAHFAMINRHGLWSEYGFKKPSKYRK